MLLTIFSMFFLAAPLFADNGAASSTGAYQIFLYLVLAIVFFYFILWRPEAKRRKVLKELRDSLKVGDTVTAMGIIGETVEIKEQTVVLQMIDGTSRIEFLKGAITEIHKKEETAQ